MTIRFTCTECGSVLKIKDEKAGTEGHCPKCKTAFRVPELEKPTEDLEAPPVVATNPAEAAPSAADSDATRESSSDAEPILRMDDDDFDSPPILSLSDDEITTPDPVEPPKPTEPPKPSKAVDTKAAKKKSKPKSDDDFDPAEFLSEGPPPPKWKAPTSTPSDFGGLSMRDEPTERSWEPPKPSKPTPSPGSTAAAAAAAWDSKMAAKQMHKAIKESRAESIAAKEAAEKGESFDYAGFIREFGLKGLAGLAAIIVLTYGLYLMVDRVMGRGIALPPLGYVSGKVTLNGQPVEGATVYFSPQDVAGSESKSSIRPRTSIAITDPQGQYRMIYIDTTQGVAIGQCRVWLSKLDEKGRQIIPGEFSEMNLTLREVKSGSQTYDFEMTSRK